MAAKKIVFIGAGSFGFTRTIVRDLLTFEGLSDATIALVDIDKGRLEMARKCCQKIVDLKGGKATVIASTRRRDVLKGADAVITTILCGDTSIWQHDILIPKKYGVDINVGDTRGPSGVFRTLRTLPEMLAICEDIRQLCPKAIYLNYTNPMAMLCHGMQKQFPELAISGLCHSVQGTAHMLAKWAGVKPEEVDYLCAGINHMAYYLKFESKGKDLYPALKKAVTTRKEIYNEEQVRNELFLAMGYYITESSGHNSEYNWWFRKRPDLIKKYCTSGTGWNPGHYAYILKEYQNRNKSWKKGFTNWLNDPRWKDAKYVADFLSGHPHEYASNIINAWTGGGRFEFNGNVPNDELIGNLPQGCCVEVPVLVSRRSLKPVRVGNLPLPLSALVSLSATNEMMAIEGALTGNPELVYQSIAHDPLTAAVLSLAEIRKMVAEMFMKNARFLKHFRLKEIQSWKRA